MKDLRNCGTEFYDTHTYTSSDSSTEDEEPAPARVPAAANHKEVKDLVNKDGKPTPTPTTPLLIHKVQNVAVGHKRKPKRDKVSGKKLRVVAKPSKFPISSSSESLSFF
jgi:hypothetical protein